MHQKIKKKIQLNLQIYFIKIRFKKDKVIKLNLIIICFKTFTLTNKKIQIFTIKKSIYCFINLQISLLDFFI